MKKSLFFKIVMLLTVVTLTVNCKDYDDDIDRLETKIESLKKDLEKDFTAKVDAKIDALQKDLDGAKANLAKAATAADIAAAKKEIEEKTVSLTEFEKAKEEILKKIKSSGNQADLDAIKEEIAKLVGGSSKLTSLVLLPDYVADEAGALPILNFSPLKTDECGDIVPGVTVKYVVNPSTLAVEDIDVENLKFRYNDPMVMTKASNAKGVDQKAEFVSLKDGILTVKATVATEKLWASQKVNSENRIDQLMLEVPVKGSDIVVSSDWAKIVSEPQELAIVKKPKKNNADAWKLYELKKYAAAEKSKIEDEKTAKKGVVVDDDTKNYTVVELVYNQELDLRKFVQAMYSKGWNNLDIEKYGFHFEFDLNNHETNKKIVYKLGPNNDTDQQEFIKLHKDGFTVSTKVYSKEGNPAAIDRTPIVHVMLKTEKGCVARHGYIKINIVKASIAPVPPVTYKQAIQAKCGEQKVYRVKTQEMNEDFYHKVGMSKTDFHKNYTFEEIAKVATDATNVGTIKQIEDANETDSYNLEYTLTEEEAWNNIGKTVWKEGKYVYGGHEIKVRFEAPVTKETIKLNIAMDNYWYNGFANIIHNVAVPEKGSEDPSTCTWVNNISTAFKNINLEDPKYSDRAKLVNLPSQGYADYTYEYVFDKQQPVSPISDIKLSVSADQKQLLATRGTTTETIAEIKAQITGAGADNGDPLEYKEDSELGKELLNKGPESMKATVILVVKNSCGKEINIEIKNLPKKDRFNIHFLRPVNVDGKSAEDFVDAVDFGDKGSYIDIKKVAQLSDWRNYVKNTNLYNFVPNNENYYKYYDVSDIKIDASNITVEGLQVDGKDVKMLPSTIVIAQTTNGETFNGVTYQFGRLTYKNNGANLNKPFVMSVPVTVTYKWGEVAATIVKITVKPTDS